MEKISKETVFQLYEDVLSVLGNHEELLDECETTTCYTIAALAHEHPHIQKVEGVFNGDKGHFWCQLGTEIIDLSVEQFEGFEFMFPLSEERRNLYVPLAASPLSQALVADCEHIASISGFDSI